MRRTRALCLLIVAVVLAYGFALRDGFVWDDTALVLRDPLIRSPLLIGEGFRHFLFIDATPANFYRPFQRIVYTWCYTFSGFQPWVFHLASILVHAGAVCALYEFSRRFCERFAIPQARWIGFFAALLWAIHPIHSSAVVYIAGLADPLAAFLGFAGLAFLISERRVMAGLFLGAALFGKESGASFAIIGLALAAWLDVKARNWRPFARVALPLVLVVAIYGGLRFTAHKKLPPPADPVSVAVRPILALRAVAEYAGLIVAPVRLRMERDVTTQTGGDVQTTLAAARLREFQTILGAALVLALIVWFRRSNAPVRACLVAALIAYVPISNILVLNATVAEHWIYVPSAFLFLAAIISLEKAIQSPVYRRLAIGTGLVWILALGVRTAIRCGDWLDQPTFLQATIRAGGDSGRMLSNLAMWKMSQGRTAEAIADYHAALQRRPGHPLLMLGLAGALIRQGSYDEAQQILEKCKAMPLVKADVLLDEAVLAYKKTGEERADLLREAAEVDPDFWPMWKRFIGHLIEKQEYGTAVTYLKAFLDRQSFRAETWYMLGQVLMKTGQKQLAQEAFSQANAQDLHLAETNRQAGP